MSTLSRRAHKVLARERLSGHTERDSLFDSRVEYSLLLPVSYRGLGVICKGRLRTKAGFALFGLARLGFGPLR